MSMSDPAVMASPGELRAYCDAHGSGIVSIKPKVLFMKIEDRFAAPTGMKLNVPSSDIGSVTLLEATAIVSMIKLTRPKAIFEFGTFLGYTACLLAENSDADCRVYSMDLGEGLVAGHRPESFKDEDLRRDGDINDEYLRSVQGTAGPRYTASMAPSDKSKLHLLHQDSRTFDPSHHGLEGAIDLVFVDGGHDTETVRIDTLNARRMIRDSGVIIWHDFGSNIHDDVTTFIQAQSGQDLFVAVQHTMLVMLLVGEAGRDFIAAGLRS